LSSSATGNADSGSVTVRGGGCGEVEQPAGRRAFVGLSDGGRSVAMAAVRSATVDNVVGPAGQS
jgi:hypothetical protein